MNIEAEKFNIQMTYQELWDTAFDVRRALEYALKDHWVRHQSEWKKHEAERLTRCRRMFDALGRNDLYQDLLIIADNTFEDFNKANTLIK
jgi:hypothetical protein